MFLLKKRLWANWEVWRMNLDDKYNLSSPKDRSTDNIWDQSGTVANMSYLMKRVLSNKDLTRRVINEINSKGDNRRFIRRKIYTRIEYDSFKDLG